ATHAASRVFSSWGAYVPVYAARSQQWGRVRRTTKKLHGSAAATSANATVNGFSKLRQRSWRARPPPMPAWAVQNLSDSAVEFRGKAGKLLCLLHRLPGEKPSTFPSEHRTRGPEHKTAST